VTEPANCPNCGAGIDPRVVSTKMLDCDSCGTTIVLDDAGLRSAGKRGTMVDAPSLLMLDRPIRVANRKWLPVGHLRFDYGPGWWDEFWCLPDHGGDGDGVWISADEGDYAFELAVPEAEWPQASERPVLGDTVAYGDRQYRLTEADAATCIALRGVLPEVITLGERHAYYNYTSDEGHLLTLERWGGGEAWHAGSWLDPFAIVADER
jgi:hypothetical protein